MTMFYGERHRKLQDQFDSREIGDVLEAVIVRPPTVNRPCPTREVPLGSYA